ncbi:MAG: hypothetical protein ABFE07_28135 [Armatimonadia bacterium]
MSHFTVLVIGPDPERQLQKFHEFECTGTDDEYVQDVDITEECRKEYNENTETRLQAPDGSLHEPYEDRFYRDPTEEEKKRIGPFGGSGCGGGVMYTSKDWGDGLGYRPKVHFVPEGWQEIQIPTFEAASFVEWLDDYHGKKAVHHGERPRTYDEHKYGYVLLDAKGQVEKVVDRTNPNKKWDWYKLGGRWTGFFALRAQLSCPVAARAGQFSLVSERRAKPGWADQAVKSDVDFEAMAAEGARNFGEYWDRIHAIIDPHPPVIPWKQFYDRHNAGASAENLEAARKDYNAQAGIVALEAAKEFVWRLDDLLVSREAYCLRGARHACLTHALLRDGNWYEQGRMGWWGAVLDEKDEGRWEEEYQKLIRDLPGDTLLSVYDCHI